MALTATCTHADLPRARIHNIISPDFVGSEFPGRDVFSDLERCEPTSFPGLSYEDEARDEKALVWVACVADAF